MPDLTDNLIELYKSSDEACIAFTRDLVRDNVQYAKDVVLTCPDRISRTCVGKLLAVIVNRMFEIEREVLFKEEEYQLEDGSKGTRPKALVVQVVLVLIHSMHLDVPRNWTKFDQFLLLMRDIIMGGEGQLLFMF